MTDSNDRIDLSGDELDNSELSFSKSNSSRGNQLSTSNSSLNNQNNYLANESYLFPDLTSSTSSSNKSMVKEDQFVSVNILFFKNIGLNKLLIQLFNIDYSVNRILFSK